MSEQDFSWEMYESAFKADEETSREAELIERAMQDPVYADTVRMVQDAKLRIDLEKMTLEAAKQEYQGGSFFDINVAHLVGNTVEVSGPLSLYDVNEEDGSTFLYQRGEVDNLTAKFQGFFVIDDVDERGQSKGPTISCGFEFLAEGENGAAVKTLAHGFPSELRLDFGMTSPQQAIAWLSVNAPDVIEQIDKKVLWTGDPYEVKALSQLADYRVKPSSYVASKEAELRLCAAIAQYLNSILSIDEDIPYRMDIDGVMSARNEKSGQYERITNVSYNRIFSIKSLALGNVVNEAGENEYKIAMYGTLHAAKADGVKKEGVYLDLDSTKNIRSIR